MIFGMFLRQFIFTLLLTLGIGYALSACNSESLESIEQKNSPVVLGTLSNGSIVSTSNSAFLINNSGTPVHGVISLSGGIPDDFNVHFGDSILSGVPSTEKNSIRSHDIDTNGITVKVAHCLVGEGRSETAAVECGYTISASKNTAEGKYSIPVIVSDGNNTARYIGSVNLLVKISVGRFNTKLT